MRWYEKKRVTVTSALAYLRFMCNATRGCEILLSNVDLVFQGQEDMTRNDGTCLAVSGRSFLLI